MRWRTGSFPRTRRGTHPGLSGSGLSGSGSSGTGEWLITRTPSGVTITHGHAKADVAVRAPAVRLLLVLTRRLPPSDPALETFGERELLTHWLQHTPY